MLDKVQLAYAAGIMDGEGTIGVYRYKGTGTYKNKISYRPDVSMANTNLKIVKLFKAWFGGTIIEKKQIKNYKVMYRWNLCSYDAVQEMISALLPYLQLKRKQAELILKFFAITKTGKGQRNKPCFSDAEKEKQNVLYEQTLRLNGGWRAGKQFPRNAEPQRLSEDGEAKSFVSDSPAQAE